MDLGKNKCKIYLHNVKYLIYCIILTRKESNVVQMKKWKRFIILGLICIIIFVLSYIFLLNFFRNVLYQHQNLNNDFEYASNLLSLRNAYVEDGLADVQLLDYLEIEKKIGRYSISIESKNEPYSLCLNFKEIVYNPSQFEQNMYRESYMLLAMIEDVSVIKWSYYTLVDDEIQKITHTVSVEDGDLKVNGSIKEEGSTVESIITLLRKLDYNI